MPMPAAQTRKQTLNTMPDALRTVRHETAIELFASFVQGAFVHHLSVHGLYFHLSGRVAYGRRANNDFGHRRIERLSYV
jgi:hypothetical protein